MSREHGEGSSRSSLTTRVIAIELPDTVELAHRVDRAGSPWGNSATGPHQAATLSTRAHHPGAPNTSTRE